MLSPTQHADALRCEVSSVETIHLVAVGTIKGAKVTGVAGRNGPGTATLRSTKETIGWRLAYKAPGSSAWGNPQRIEADGTVLLEDGEDTSKWVRVQVWVDYLDLGRREGSVKLREVYNNDVGSDDVTAAEATAGDVETYTVTLANDGTLTISQIKIWLDPSTVNLEISDDGASWVSPTTEATALELPDLASGSTDTLHIRRTIAAGEASDPAVLSRIHLAFSGL